MPIALAPHPDQSPKNGRDRKGLRLSVARFRALWLDPGLSRRQIGEMLGITASAVGWRAKAYGLPPRQGGEKPRYDLDDPLFLAMWQANVRPQDMGLHYGVRASAILWNARRLNLSRDCTRHNSISLAQFRELDLGRRMAAAVAAEQRAQRMARRLEGERLPAATRQQDKRAA